MALLEELDSAPGADKFPEMYDKINTLIQTVNAVLGGGDAGQFPAKIDSTDFNFAFIDQPIIKFKSIDIGAWNMNNKIYITIAHGIATPDNIRSAYALIISDDSLVRTSLEVLNAGYGIPAGAGGAITIQNTTLLLSRVGSGTYDNTNYNDASMNRGYITIGYIE